MRDSPLRDNDSVGQSMDGVVCGVCLVYLSFNAMPSNHILASNFQWARMTDDGKNELARVPIGIERIYHISLYWLRGAKQGGRQQQLFLQKSGVEEE